MTSLRAIIREILDNRLGGLVETCCGWAVDSILVQNMWGLGSLQPWWCRRASKRGGAMNMPKGEAGRLVISPRHVDAAASTCRQELRLAILAATVSSSELWSWVVWETTRQGCSGFLQIRRISRRISRRMMNLVECGKNRRRGEDDRLPTADALSRDGIFSNPRFCCLGAWGLDRAWVQRPASSAGNSIAWHDWHDYHDVILIDSLDSGVPTL
jgi:hypothetical protein